LFFKKISYLLIINDFEFIYLDTVSNVNQLPVKHFPLPANPNGEWFSGKYTIQTNHWGIDSITSKMEMERIRFDDNKIVVATHSNTIEIFDSATGAWKESLQGHMDWVWDFAFNQTHLVSASCDHSLILWELSPEVSSNYPPSSSSFALNFNTSHLNVNTNDTVNNHTHSHHHHHHHRNEESPDEMDEPSMASETKQLQKYIGHDGWVQCVQFDSQKIVSGSGDQSVRVWDMETAKCLTTLQGHLSFVYCLQYGDNFVVSGSGGIDKSIKLWDIRMKQSIGTLEGHTATIMCLLFHDTVLASGSFDKTIKVWDLRMKKCRYTLKGHSSAVGCLHFAYPQSSSPGPPPFVSTSSFYSSPSHFSSPVLVSGSHDSTVKLWDFETGELKHTLSAHSGVVVGVKMSEDSLISCSVDKTIKKWKFLS